MSIRMSVFLSIRLSPRPTVFSSQELGPQGPQRFTGLPDGQTFLRAGGLRRDRSGLWFRDRLGVPLRRRYVGCPEGAP